MAEIELAAVHLWMDSPNATYLTADEQTRIVLRCDGAGPMGWYDRIHVHRAGWRSEIFPAHMVSGWVVKEQADG